jgi:pimeloyl-ACP methyl ester carboxylesterase
VRLAYRAFGSGRPVVLVQGLGGTMDAWDPRFLDAVARQGRRVVVFDNEGVGRSRLRSGELTIRRMGDDTAALIRKLRLRRPDVVAWSMGGMITQSLAVRHPRLVRRLVLMASAPGDGLATPPTQRAFDALQGNANDLLALLFSDPGAEAATRTYITNLGLRRNPNLTLPPEVQRAQLVASGHWLAGDEASGAGITSLRHRVLVGGGRLDDVLPIANQRHLAKAIPRARLVEYPRAAHAFYLQHRRDWLRRLDRFLG